mmetsp:Transcript_42578/g.40834  ORF Transcript_42578/g.40834 Transcript_42578/m.40834 type:complete len:247 (-) Transcript_42578:143-883(-)
MLHLLLQLLYLLLQLVHLLLLNFLGDPQLQVLHQTLLLLRVLLQGLLFLVQSLLLRHHALVELLNLHLLVLDLELYVVLVVLHLLLHLSLYALLQDRKLYLLLEPLYVALLACQLHTLLEHLVTILDLFECWVLFEGGLELLEVSFHFDLLGFKGHAVLFLFVNDLVALLDPGLVDLVLVLDLFEVSQLLLFLQLPIHHLLLPQLLVDFLFKGLLPLFVVCGELLEPVFIILNGGSRDNLVAFGLW